MKGQASGFGMSWSLPADASQSAATTPEQMNESAQSQQVQGQVLEEVEMSEQVDQPNWMIIFGWLVLFVCILFGVITSLHQQRKIPE